MKTRICCKCKIDKELSSEFFVKDKHDITGFTYQCKLCRSEKQNEWRKNNPEKIKLINKRNKEKRKLYYSSNKGIESSRKSHLKIRFGLTLEDYNIMLEAQNHKCQICGKKEMNNKNKVLCIDHNHETNQIRGLLCGLCNSGLGKFLENKELLLNAIKYIEKYESNA